MSGETDKPKYKYFVGALRYTKADIFQDDMLCFERLTEEEEEQAYFSKRTCEKKILRWLNIIHIHVW